MILAQQTAPAATTEGENVSYTFNLQEGTNLISLPVITSYTAESFAMAAGTKVQHIAMYNTTGGEYKTYLPGFSGAENNFAVKADYGYYVFTAGNCSFTITGSKPGIRSIPLKRGFNLIGWTSLDQSTAEDAFTTPLGSNLINVSKRNSDGSLRTYTPGVSGKEDNFAVEPGSGYLVYIKNDCTLTYGGAKGPAGEPLEKEPASGKSVYGFEAAYAVAGIAMILIARNIRR